MGGLVLACYGKLGVGWNIVECVKISWRNRAVHYYTEGEKIIRGCSDIDLMLFSEMIDFLQI